jgi:hypothetical protein
VAATAALAWTLASIALVAVAAYESALWARPVPLRLLLVAQPKLVRPVQNPPRPARRIEPVRIELETPVVAPPFEPAALLTAFGPLSQAEEDVCTAALQGLTVGLRDPRTPRQHPQARVRAALVRFLATAQDGAPRVHERGFGLRGMCVDGELDLSACELRRPLRFIDCWLDDVDITGATLSTFTLNGGRVGAIVGDRCEAMALFLRGVRVFGGVRLLGARIAGDLDCSGATLVAARPASVGREESTAENAALSLDGATINGAVFLRATRVQGSVVANSLAVAKLVDARKLFVCSGQVALDSAVLGGDVQFRGAAIRTSPPYAASPYAQALVLTQARIAGSLRLDELFQADGPVDLSDARINGNLSIRAALFTGHGEFALVAQRLQVEGAFYLDSRTCFGPHASARAAEQLPPLSDTLTARQMAQLPQPAYVRGAALDLTEATVGSLSDQWAHWPRGNRVLGFRYRAIAGATSTRAAWWVRWLQLQCDEDLRDLTDRSRVSGRAGFKPQPWDQAMLALRAAGCQRDAEDVAIAKETAAHAFDHGLLRRLRHAWGVCAGYGYRPLRLLWALPFVYLFSGALYSLAALHGVMAPTNEDFLDKSEYQHCRPEFGGNWSRCALAPAYPDFYPWTYALQMLLPVIELRQSKDWAPVPWVRPARPILAVAVAASPAAATSASRAATPGSTSDVAQVGLSLLGAFTLGWSWCESTLGLVAPVLVGLALTGLIRRKLGE